MKGHELIVCKSYKIVANLSQNASQYQCRVTKKLQVKKLYSPLLIFADHILLFRYI